MVGPLGQRVDDDALGLVEFDEVKIRVNWLLFVVLLLEGRFDPEDPSFRIFPVCVVEPACAGRASRRALLFSQSASMLF